MNSQRDVRASWNKKRRFVDYEVLTSSSGAIGTFRSGRVYNNNEITFRTFRLRAGATNKWKQMPVLCMMIIHK